MDNPRPEKVAKVAEVRERLDDADAVVLTDYRGLNVRAMADLRTSLHAAGGEIKVYKNTMVRFAANELELDVDDLLTGPTAIAYTAPAADGTPGDPVALAKALTAFSKDNDRLVIKGGLLANRRLTVEEVVALSKIAPREELLARLAGGFAAPMQQFAAVLAAVPQKFAYAMQALIEAGGASDAPAGDTTDAADTDGEAAAVAPEEDAAEAASDTPGAGDAGAGESTDAAGDDTAADDTSAGDGNEQES
ncbi:MAG: 50S ribosomal protein L10 [Acidimicrobiales bacterium]